MAQSLLRICISAGIFPPDIGGPASYVPRVAEALSRRGDHVVVVALSDHLRHDDSCYPFRVIRIHRDQLRPLRILKTARAITKVAKESDVIFANGLFIEAAIAKWVSGRPVVMKVVGDWAWERSVVNGWTGRTVDDFQKSRCGLRVEMLKLLRWVVTRQADQVLVPSRYLGRLVQGWGVSGDHVKVIYNAVEKVGSVEAVKLPPFGGLTIVTACRLVPWKGVGAILRVVAEVPGVRLVVVGDGPEAENLRTLARTLSIEDRVVFAGQVSRREVASYLKAGDVFVLNSTYEGFPHTVLEAMQLGLPVVATDVGGNREVIDDGVNGLLVRVGDGGDLKRALAHLLEDSGLRETLGCNGVRKVEEIGDWGKVVEETEELLMRVAVR